jgi:heat shock protein HtpX
MADLAPAASFYALESKNRRMSIVLMVVTILILVLMGTLIGTAMAGDVVGALPVSIGAAVIAFLSVAGSYYMGDSAVIAATNAKLANPTRDAQLINIVNELSLAAGIPAPKVYIIPDTALNAFATGRDPQHASIAVTEGLVAKLDREELQGVIGHELSHIRNLDIRFALLLAALVGAIVLMADLFLHNLRLFRPRGKKSDGAIVVVFLLAIVFALLAPFLARLIQLAASRQREYLADSSSVELTRNPVGMERALLEVGRDRQVLEVANRATQHLYFSNPIHKSEKRSKGLLSTHPSIPDRVNRLRGLRGAAPLDEATLAEYSE